MGRSARCARGRVATVAAAAWGSEGRVTGHKHACVPKIGLQFRAPLIIIDFIFIFLEGSFCDVGGWVGGRLQGSFDNSAPLGGGGSASTAAKGAYDMLLKSLFLRLLLCTSALC